MSRCARAAAATAALLGLLALAGWATGWLRLAALAHERIPMAPSTALLFLLLGGTLTLLAGHPPGDRARRAATAAAGAATLVAAALQIGPDDARWRELEHLGFGHALTLDGAPLGHMSPVTAALFVLAGAAALLLLAAGDRWRHNLAPALAAGGVAIAGLCFVLAYLLGEPLLYGGAFIPPALSTSLAFLAIGLAILLLAVDRARTPAGPDAPERSRAALVFVGLLALLAAVVLAGAYAYFARYEQRFRASVQATLAAVADLKVHELALWCAERAGDAAQLRANPAFGELAARALAEPPDAAARVALRGWLDAVRTSYRYLAVGLLDGSGRLRMASSAAPDAIGAHVAADAATAARRGEVAFLDFHRDQPGGPARVALVAPIRADAADGGGPVGAVVLVVDPEIYLYPMLRRWPTPATSAASRLVRREGDRVLFLDDGGPHGEGALTLAFPIDSPRLPAAMVARGLEGEVEGIDERGRPVIAALRAVPGSPWRLVAQIETGEAMAPARERLWGLVALLAALLVAAVAALAALWQRDAKAHYRALAGAREALARSEATLRTIFDNAADGIVIADVASRRLERANAAFFRMLGYRPEDLERLRVDDLHPAEELPRALEEFSREQGDGPRQIADFGVRRADGSELVVAIAASPIELDGRPHLLGVFRDVSERRAAETRIAYLNSVLLAIRNVNQLISREKNRDVLVQRACELLVAARGFGAVAIGLAGADGTLASRGVAGEQLALVEPDAAGAPPPCARAALERGDLAVDRDAAVGFDLVALPLEQEGERHGWLAAALAAGMCEDPEELALLREAVNDIAHSLRALEVEAARDRSSAELAELDAQLRQAQKMEAIGRLAGGIAHDFNNLLMVILGYCEALLRHLAPTDPGRADAEEIASAGRRAAGLTRQLLAFSRAQALQPEVLDLDRVVADTEAMLRRVLGEDIELATHLAAAPGMIEADRGQLEQVLMNLAVNARDAMPRGGRLMLETARVELDADFARHHLDAPAGSYVLLSVADSGCGMDAATRARIFEPFFTTKPKGSGTGLGLSTVYGIVKQSRGSIWVYSEPEKGTTFRIYLPRASGSPAPPPKAEPRPAPGGGEHLLVVEDEPALRTLLEAMLGGLGYRVTLAADGRAAVALVEAQGLRPDLLLSDVVMPGLGGPQLAARLRATLPDLRVLLMSGYTDDALAHHGALTAGTGILQKPFTSVELASRLAVLLGRSGAA